MGYEVLARKWRPQQFDDVVGQEHVTQTLKNAIESDRIHHAFLFVGPRGIGKTSVARIFAKALNCQNGGPTATPCDKCDSCREIMAGNSMDVLEIDGASNNGVDDVRELRETVKFAPARSKFKIYIIDEVHMLSKSAFNALLKTLEEPPPHVKFMFATTEPEKVLSTIVSRCQRFDLRRISVVKIVERLKLIAEAEGIEVEPDALLAIARGAEGGMRDAQSAFDQLISFTGKKISEQDVLTVFGLVSRTTLENLAQNVLTGDIRGVISIVGELDNAGKDLQRVVVELMDHFRNLLICLNVDEPGGNLDLTEDQVKALQEQAKFTNTGRLLRVVDVLTETESRMRYALSRRTLLETSLIRCARAASVVTLNEILDKINALKSGEPLKTGNTSNARVSDKTAGYIVNRPAPTAASTDPAPQAVSRPPAAVAAAPKRAAAPAVNRSPAQPVKRTSAAGRAEKKPSAPGGGADLEKLIESWPLFLERVGSRAVALKAALRDICPLEVDELHVKFGYLTEFAEEVENFKSKRIRAVLQLVLKDILGRTVEPVFVAVDELTNIKKEVAPVPEYDPDTPVEMPEDEDAGRRQGRTREELHQDKYVQQVLEAFSGTVIL